MSQTGLADVMMEPAARAQPHTQSSSPTRRHLPSVRLLITLIVVVPITVVSALLIAITSVTSNGIAQELGQQMLASATERVTFDVKNYMGAAIRLSNLYDRRVRDGTLSITNLGSWERTMFNDLATNADVASICFSDPEGNCTWLLRAYHKKDLELGLVRADAMDKAVEHPMSPDGVVDRTRTIRPEYLYDARQRPWYKTAMEPHIVGPVWTPIYAWFLSDRPQDASVMGTGYTRAIRTEDGKLLGVLVIDVTLSAFSDYLKQLPIAQAGHAFIADEKGLLVAASEGAVNADKGEQLPPVKSTSAAAQAIAPLLDTVVRHFDLKPLSQTARIFVGEQQDAALAQITQITPFPGIHWHVITVLPESYFMAQASQLQSRAILLALGAIAVGTAVGLFLSRRISVPLVHLSRHVARVGAGDFDTRLDLAHASELRRLSDEVNRMAGGLKHRMMLERTLAVAEQVQQALLPLAMPRMAGMEVAACSKYCESTGGDYYDFIEMPDLEGANHTLIAVGDVTGHGIGAALLMATARGAVRSACLGAISLGHILTRANNVLAGSSQQGMFMTLSLVWINPQTGFVHWASAGHDPTIAYHPDTDGFEELFSGDVPLGIEPDMVYREFSRRCALPGTVFVIGTDGIWEARGEDGSMFGKDRLRQIMRQHSHSAEAISEAIKREMYNFTGDSPLRDDVTFVVLRIC